jgi:hypothetical protein
MSTEYPATHVHQLRAESEHRRAAIERACEEIERTVAQLERLLHEFA